MTNDGGNFARAVTYFVEKDVTLAEAIKNNPAFGEVLQLAVERADLFAETIRLHLETPNLLKPTTTTVALRYFLSTVGASLDEALRGPLPLEDVGPLKATASMLSDLLGRDNTAQIFNMAPGIN